MPGTGLTPFDSLNRVELADYAREMLEATTFEDVTIEEPVRYGNLTWVHVTGSEEDMTAHEFAVVHKGETVYVTFLLRGSATQTQTIVDDVMTSIRLTP